MFWKKKEEEQKSTETQPAAAEKPCCSGKKKDGESTTSEQTTAAPVQQKQHTGLSTFEFGGNVASGVKLVGQCQGTDPNNIQACIWRPSADDKHTILF